MSAADGADFVRAAISAAIQSGAPRGTVAAVAAAAVNSALADSDKAPGASSGDCTEHAWCR